MARAAEYSSQLIDVFAETLPINWDGNVPIIFPDEIDLGHIRSFHAGYRDVSESSFRDSAITDLDSFTRESGLLQTTGVGLADDFNHFVNLGLLLGHRVVLWDTVILGTFFPPDRRLDQEAIAKVAGEFLYLKSVIKDGGVVMLPHPSLWLERCNRYMQALVGIDGLTPAFAGYVNARALRDEGFDLHPYTLTKADDLNVELGGSDAKGSLHSERATKDTKSVKELMCDTRFAYLRDLDTTHLYQFLKNHSGWKEELAKLLRIPDYIKTVEDTHKHLATVKDRLQNGIDVQNDSFAMDKANCAASGLAFIACVIGIASSPYDAGQFLGGIGGSISFVTGWLALSRLLKTQTDESVTLYQGFKTLRATYDNQQLSNPQNTG